MSNLQIIKSVFESDDVRKRFQEMLGKKAPGFIVSVINVVQNDKTLAQADRNSILLAAGIAAGLDLPIEPNLGLAYIIPYKTKEKIKTEDGKEIWSEKVLAQFQMGYKGFTQLALRSGQFKTIAVTEIYEGQLVESNPLTGYKFDFTVQNSSKIIGYAGYFELINGFEKTSYMSIKELEQHGLKYSQSYKKGYGLWKDNFDAMAKKTVLKLLLSKFAPLSIEIQTAILEDQKVNNNYLDNQKPSLAEVVEDKEIARVRSHIENSTYLEQLEEAGEYVAELEDGHELKTLYLAKKKELEKLI